jgi:hypothetical protein
MFLGNEKGSSAAADNPFICYKTKLTEKTYFTTLNLIVLTASPVLTTA